MLSSGEREYVLEGIRTGHRTDGRGRLDFRTMELQTGVVTGCNGSARLRVSETDILVGVKVDLGEPDAEFPDEGKVLYSVDVCPAAAVDGGSEDMALQLQRSLEAVTSHSSAIDLGGLCILAGRQCWIVYVDVLVLNSAGNLNDAVSICTKAALYNTRVPKYTLTGTGEADGEDETEIDISGDADDGVALDVRNLPIMVSLFKVQAQYITDATKQEELCANARLTFAVNSDGHVFTVQKGGSGGVQPAVLTEMLQVSKKVGSEVSKWLSDCLTQLDAAAMGDEDAMMQTSAFSF